MLSGVYHHDGIAVYLPESINVTLGITRRGLQRQALPVLHYRRHTVELEELATPLNVSHDAVDELILGKFRKRIVDQNWSTHAGILGNAANIEPVHAALSGSSAEQSC